jgi:hypothetical protein
MLMQYVENVVVIASSEVLPSPHASRRPSPPIAAEPHVPQGRRSKSTAFASLRLKAAKTQHQVGRSP